MFNPKLEGMEYTVETIESHDHIIKQQTIRKHERI